MQLATHTSDSLICSCQTMQRAPAQAVGCFKLPPRHAVTLTIRAPGELQLAHGRVWVTFANAAQDASTRAGDHFLQAGETLRLVCGQQVVMETLDAAPDASVYFSWVLDASAQQAALPRGVQHAHAPVRQSLLDLGTALHQAGEALGRLVHGVGRSLACTLMLRHGTS